MQNLLAFSHYCAPGGLYSRLLSLSYTHTLSPSSTPQQVAVLLVEPQWGSIACAQPWPRDVIQYYIKAAKERGIKVCPNIADFTPDNSTPCTFFRFALTRSCVDWEGMDMVQHSSGLLSFIACFWLGFAYGLALYVVTLSFPHQLLPLPMPGPGQ